MSTAGCRPRMNSRSSVRASTTSSWAAGQGLADGFGFGLEPLPGHTQVHGQRYQPLLRAVVQVAFDPAAFGVGRGDQIGAAAGQRLDPQRQRLAAAGPEQRPGQALVGPGHPPGQRRHDGKQGNQQAPGQAGEHRKQVVRELVPGAPQGPNGRRDLRPKRRAEPGSLHGAEPMHQPRGQRHDQEDYPDVHDDVLPVIRAGRQREQGHAPDHDEHAEQDTAQATAGEHAARAFGIARQVMRSRYSAAGRLVWGAPAGRVGFSPVEAGWAPRLQPPARSALWIP